MSEPIELLSCPFCGSPAEFVFNDQADDGCGDVRCTDVACGASHYVWWGNAAEWWNRRKH